MVRQAAVAGTWYPGTARELAERVDGYLAAAAGPRLRHVTAIIAPHAGLMYSGPVAGYAYRQLQNRAIDVIVLVGPAHAGGFEGVAVYSSGAFETPLGAANIDSECAARLIAASPIVRDNRAPHVREHSLEMQLPFVRRVAPTATIVPLLMGWQTAETARALGDAIPLAVGDRRAMLIASTDLSHYEDARTASRLDAVVIDYVQRVDPEGLQDALNRNPRHACGGGPTIAVMHAARTLGANAATILNYADSGDVTGDKSSVVGYLAAAFGTA